MPRIGDRVRIDGFLGVFEIVRIERNGLMVDVKHLGWPGSDYIEKEILTRELQYLDTADSSVRANEHVTGGANNPWPAASSHGDRRTGTN